MTWAGQQAVTNVTEKFEKEEFKDFNEMLTVGYTEKGAMGVSYHIIQNQVLDSNLRRLQYHTDGESTLGPTVATLSLGASAVMHFRPMGKSKIGKESKNSRGTKRDVLNIPLQHGDMIVMHGAQIQQLYEVSTCFSSFLIENGLLIRNSTRLRISGTYVSL
jgi:hypothetical protein